MPKIGVRLPGDFDSAGEFLADVQALESAGADLLLLAEGSLDREILLAAMAAVTARVQLHAPKAGNTLERLARGRLAGDLEGWKEVDFPVDRTAWRATLAEHEGAGVSGLILGMDARLIDLLRNPDLEDDRANDLQLAQG